LSPVRVAGLSRWPDSGRQRFAERHRGALEITTRLANEAELVPRERELARIVARFGADEPARLIQVPLRVLEPAGATKRDAGRDELLMPPLLLRCAHRGEGSSRDRANASHDATVVGGAVSRGPSV
jgi:hypothetical protein